MQLVAKKDKAQKLDKEAAVTNDFMILVQEEYGEMQQQLDGLMTIPMLGQLDDFVISLVICCLGGVIILASSIVWLDGSITILNIG